MKVSGDYRRVYRYTHFERNKCGRGGYLRLSSITLTNTTIAELPVIVANEEEECELITSNVSLIDEKAATS